MIDDIVPRLRMSADLMVGFPKMLAKNTPSQWLVEAADEIERLRTALDLWKKIAKQMFDAHNHWAGDETWCDAYFSDTAQCDCGYQKLADKYEQAVRDGL